ncbi:MAG: prepilin-type N-terminal cleavage/methylation domain-containing protein [Candidatus Shapirobacteria bacterium]|jgi:prepilin-type N-terminal cleavage/methylation domain-containing protein
MNIRSPTCRQAGFTLIELLVAITVVALISFGALIYLNNFNSRKKLDSGRNEVVSALELAQSYAKTRQAPVGFSDSNLEYVRVVVNENSLSADMNGVGVTYFSNLIGDGEVFLSGNPATIYFWAGGKLSHDVNGNLYGVGESAGVNVKSKSEDGGNYEVVINALGQVSGGEYTK